MAMIMSVIMSVTERAPALDVHRAHQYGLVTEWVTTGGTRLEPEDP
jgi:hypothetical protein